MKLFDVARFLPLKHTDPHMSEIISGAGISLTWRIIGAGLAFVFSLLLARFLGGQQAGLYFLAISIVMVVSVASRLGLDNALVRFAASNASQENWIGVRGLVVKGIGIAGMLSLVTTIILFAGADWAARTIFSE